MREVNVNSKERVVESKSDLWLEVGALADVVAVPGR